MQIPSQAFALYNRMNAIEAPRPLGREPSSGAGSDSAQARMTSKKVGISFGAFGLEYSSSSLQLAESLSAEAVAQKSLGKAFATEADIEALRQQMVHHSVDERARSLGGKTQASSMHTCLCAYARAAKPQSTFPGSVFSSVA